MKKISVLFAALVFVAFNAYAENNGSADAFATVTQCAKTYAVAYAPITAVSAGDIGKGAVAACNNALTTYYQYVNAEQGTDRAIVADDKARNLIEDETIAMVLDLRYPNRIK